MNDIHRPHRPSGIIKHPLLGGTQIRTDLLILFQQRDDIRHNARGVVSMVRNRGLGNRMQLSRGEDVKIVQMSVEVEVEGWEEGYQEEEPAGDAGCEAGDAG